MISSTCKDEALDCLTAGIAQLTSSETWSTWLRTQARIPLTRLRAPHIHDAGNFFKEIRKAVSDRHGGVRSRGEAAHKGGAK